MLGYKLNLYIQNYVIIIKVILIPKPNKSFASDAKHAQGRVSFVKKT